MTARGPDVRACLARNQLQLILMPTEACNFRCRYCYEDFALGRMEPWVVRGVENLLARRVPDLDALTLSWFGGEPLLARDLVEHLLSRTRALLRDHPRIAFASNLTTNAYLLTRQVFNRLLELGVRKYQVSLDGPRTWHDRKRVLAGGHGTFDRIWRNLLELRDVAGDFTVIVRLHVDRDNYEAVPEFIDQFRQGWGHDGRFQLFLRRLSRRGGPNDAELRVFEADEAQEKVGELSRCAREQRVAVVSCEPGPLVCYAAHGNIFLVRADGRLNKCTVALDHPMNQVGKIQEDGTLDLSGPKMLLWMRGVWSRDTGELECPKRGLADLVRPAATAGRRRLVRRTASRQLEAASRS